MKIEQLKLENFKCFKTEKTFDFARLTILTGANSSGKSTIVQAVLSALQSDGFPNTYSPNGKYVNLGSFRDITYKGNKNNIKLSFKFCFKVHDYLDSMEIETSWSENKLNLLPTLHTLTFKEASEEELGIHCKRTKFDKDLDAFEFTFRAQERRLKVSKALERSTYLNKFNMKTTFNQKQLTIVAKFADFFKFREYVIDEMNTLNLPTKDFEAIGDLINASEAVSTSAFDLSYYSQAFTEKDKYINHIGALRTPPSRTYFAQNKNNFKLGTNGEGYIDQIVEWEMHADDTLTKLVAIMEQMDLIKEVKTKRLSGGRLELLVKTLNSSVFTSLSDVGFGVSQFFPIIVADLQLPNDSTLFLEEPETHLHPSIQAKFGQYIVNQVNTTDKNYIIETHSEYFLNRIRLAIVKGELKKSDIKVYFLENTPKDTNVYDIDFTKTGAIQNAPPTFFETYSMDVMNIALNSFHE